MSNELMSQFNMKGNNQKLSFKSSAICGTVIGKYVFIQLILYCLNSI